VRVAVVVPTYQEAENIGPFLRATRAALPDAAIVVCEDNSPDGTGRIADEVGAEIGQVTVLHRPGKAGLGAAYRHGFRVALDAGAEVVIQMDVDFSHPHEMLPGMVAAIEDGGADVVVGSRYVPGGGTPDWSLHRKLLSHWGNLYARFMLRLAMRDSTSGLRAYRAGALERIRFGTTRANGYGFQIETAYRLGASGAEVVEQPLVFVDRVHGSSKMSVKIMFENTLLVTWWGLCMRLPRATQRFRATAAGKQLEAWNARSIRGA
jgi:dolichol-phosphate mannosyltransferase